MVVHRESVQTRAAITRLQRGGPSKRRGARGAQVPDLSPAAQKIVRHYTNSAGRKAWKWVSVSSVTGAKIEKLFKYSILFD